MNVQQSLTNETPEIPGVRAFPDHPEDAERIDGLTLKSELNIYLKAASAQLKNPDRWPISAQQRESMVSRAMHIIEHSRDTRAVTKAMLVMAKLDEINLQAARDKDGTKVNVNVSTAPADLSRLTDAELEARLAALEAGKAS